jgi:hypothetical protein
VKFINVCKLIAVISSPILLWGCGSFWGGINSSICLTPNALWAIGGFNGTTTVDTVLKTLDGSAWSNCGTLPAPVTAGYIYNYNGQVYYGAGIQFVSSGTPVTNVSKSSAFGDAWTVILPTLQGARFGGVGLVYSNKMWAFGGFDATGNGAAVTLLVRFFLVICGLSRVQLLVLF